MAEDRYLPSVKRWRAFRIHREFCVPCQAVNYIEGPATRLCYAGYSLWTQYVTAATSEADEADRITP